MTTSATFPNDVTIKGTLNAASVNLNASAKNSDISPTADLDYDKLEHLHAIHVERVQLGTTAITDVSTHIAHIAKGATGSVLAVEIACGVVPTAAGPTQTIDVKKGTSSVLNTTVVLSSANTEFVSVSGSLLTTAVKDYTAGDVLVVTMTPTTHTSDIVQSPGVTIYVREDAA